MKFESFLSPGEATPEHSRDKWKKRLRDYFTVYDPAQLTLIDQWLDNWRGREGELFAALVKHHGPEPIDDGAARTLLIAHCRQLLEQLYLLYRPEEFLQVPAVMNRWRDREEELVVRLQKQVIQRDVIYEFYHKYFPERMVEVPLVLREWFGREHELMAYVSQYVQFQRVKTVAKELELIAKKERKAGGTGVEDRKDGDSDSEASSSDDGEGAKERRAQQRRARQQQAQLQQHPIPLPFQQLRTQLVHFYQLYKPDKLEQVEHILDVYRGREDKLFQSVRRKYGLEVADIPKAAPREAPPVTFAGVSKLKGLPTGPPPLAQISEELKHRVFALAKSWNVPQAVLLPSMLKDFKGTEARFFEVLMQYGDDVMKMKPPPPAQSENNSPAGSTEQQREEAQLRADDTLLDNPDEDQKNAMNDESNARMASLCHRYNPTSENGPGIPHREISAPHPYHSPPRSSLLSAMNQQLADNRVNRAESLKQMAMQHYLSQSFPVAHSNSIPIPSRTLHPSVASPFSSSHQLSATMKKRRDEVQHPTTLDEWLAKYELSRFLPVFAANDVNTMDVFLSLTERDFEGLGIIDKNILRRINNLIVAASEKRV